MFIVFILLILSSLDQEQINKKMCFTRKLHVRDTWSLAFCCDYR